MSRQRPKVSVCIASYNYGHFIGQAIQSVLDQTFPDFELVILDNLSTDNSEAVITSFDDKRIRFYKDTQRIGLYPAWNKLLSLAKGKYIVTLAADDMLLPDMLARETQVLDSNPAVGLVYSKVKWIDAEGVAWGETSPTEEEDYIRSGEEEFKNLILLSYIIQPSVMIRRECHQRLGGYNEELPYCSDWEMYLRIALSYDIAFIATPLACFRKHESSLTTRSFKSNMMGMQAYWAIKTVFSKLPDEKSHLRSLEPKAVNTLAKRQVLGSFDSLTSGDASLARRNIALGIAIDSSVLKNISTYLLFFLSLFGSRVGRLIGRVSPPVRKAYRRGGLASKLINRL